MLFKEFVSVEDFSDTLSFYHFLQGGLLFSRNKTFADIHILPFAGCPTTAVLNSVHWDTPLQKLKCGFRWESASRFLLVEKPATLLSETNLFILFVISTVYLCCYGKLCRLNNPKWEWAARHGPNYTQWTWINGFEKHLMYWSLLSQVYIYLNYITSCQTKSTSSKTDSRDHYF